MLTFDHEKCFLRCKGRVERVARLAGVRALVGEGGVSDDQRSMTFRRGAGHSRRRRQLFSILVPVDEGQWNANGTTLDGHWWFQSYINLFFEKNTANNKPVSPSVTTTMALGLSTIVGAVQPICKNFSLLTKLLKKLPLPRQICRRSRN